jgi:xanthine dehydrogenase YagS FAD-binding subunit
MDNFVLITPADRASAIAAAAKKTRTRFIGGGTNLVDLMKVGVERPSQVINLNPLPMDKIEARSAGGLRIGALVRNSDLAYDDRVRKKYAVLSEALLSGASPQLRNMATVGGNLMQRTRCPYFYDVVFACNKRAPGSGCAAMNGYTRSHAVLGTSDECIATHPSDMCVALVALNATVHVEGPAGERAIPIEEFHLLPGETPERETALKLGELIVAVDMPEPLAGSRSHYLKVRDRASYEFALASAGVVLQIADGKIRSARLALGGVGTKPWRAKEAEDALTGKEASVETFRAAADAAMKHAAPRKHNGFKVELAKRTLVSALKQVGGVA